MIFPSAQLGVRGRRANLPPEKLQNANSKPKIAICRAREVAAQVIKLVLEDPSVESTPRSEYRFGKDRLSATGEGFSQQI
jgi:hypothetical protein